uniref:3-hydroxyanthranilate 3,4-dioxygenase n=1 Tax=Periophthalmus magnuspinnatus TaxID=409849 RepID=A0A3B4A6E1_9GOBI
MTDSSLLVNVEKWIEVNKHSFNPPVCNKLMHFCQLNIMFVGGPNTRKDYHIEEGEELFYQVKGDMCLKVVENGRHKDVHIKEGEMFLLPARIPHSPQRQADTVGLVVERRRLPSETDCLRYYVENTTDLLFERWFYCQDLGTQLVPVIREFMASTQAKTGRPDPSKDPPFQMNTMNVMSPFCFKSWLNKHRAALRGGGPIDLFGAQFETEAMVFGPGETENTTRPSDAWIWQLHNMSHLKPLTPFCLPVFFCRYQWQRDEDTVALFVIQNPERKRP